MISLVVFQNYAYEISKINSLFKKKMQKNTEWLTAKECGKLSDNIRNQ